MVDSVYRHGQQWCRVASLVAGAWAMAGAMTGCTPLGPSTINWGRTAYNQSVQETEAQQLLLNIVRQRYNDPVMFLDVTNISSTTTRTANFSLSAVLPNNARNTLNSGVGGVFTESPLIFYAPNTGAKFVNQILTPLDIKTLSLMLQSGWSIERVLMVAGESIDGIRNSTAGKGRGGANPYADYRTLVSALRDLQRSGQLSASIEPKGANDADLLLLTPSEDSVGTDSYLRVCRILARGCDGGPIRFQLGIGKNAPDSPIVSLATRSLYASFYFLSDGVDPPAADLVQGVVQERGREGGPFDRSANDLFQVHSSAAEPADAAVKVFYRDTWFYISETDVDSKTTFALISMLLMLQGGDPARMAPLVSVSPG